MIRIDEDELDSLEYLGSGKFGTVYKKDDEVAYKIYHKIVADECGFAHDNPALELSKSRFKRLIKKSKELVYTGGVLDTISIGREFRGVVIPYYEGETLDKLIDLPIKDKVFISKQIIECSKELFRNNIYPFDYKLNNVILSNNQVRLIDLDDIHTHVCHTPNPLGYSISINGLNEMLQVFFKEYKRSYVPRKISKSLLRNNGRFTLSYKSLEGYIKDKSEERNIIMINDNTDLEELKRTMKKDDYIVYVVTNLEATYPTLERLKEYGISLYDIVFEDKVAEYEEIENINKILVK